MELTFEKWEDGRWFVVLPDYDGDQEDLAGSWEGHGDRYIGSLFRVDEPVPDDSAAFLSFAPKIVRNGVCNC